MPVWEKRTHNRVAATMLNKERDTQPDTVKITFTRIDENIGMYGRGQK